MDKNLRYFILGLFLLLTFPPFVVFIFNWRNLNFQPSIFITEWYKFLLTTIGLFINFVLIYMIWERRKNKQLFQVDLDILIFEIDNSIKLIKKCLSLATEPDPKNRSGEEINKNIKGKLKGLDNLTSILEILERSGYRNYNGQYAKILEEVFSNSNNFKEQLEEVYIFTSSNSDGVRLLTEFRDALINEKDRLEALNV